MRWLLIGALVIGLFLLPAPASAAWWNVSFNRCMNISIKSALIDVNVTDIPLAINLSSSVINYGHTQDDASDIRIVDNGCGCDGSEVPHVTEKWNESYNSIVWFLANPDAAVDINYSMYYLNNTDVVTTDDANGTFTNNYDFVAFLNATSGDFVEVLNNHGNGTPQNFEAADYRSESRPDGGIDITPDDAGGDESVDYAAWGYSPESFFTWEAWINLDDNTRSNVIWGQLDPDPADGDGMFFKVNSDEPYMYICEANGCAVTTIRETNAANLAQNTWYYVSATAEDNNPFDVHFRVNGVYEPATSADVGGGADVINNASATMKIGRRERGGAASRGYDGKIGMVAMSYSNRSDAWFKATYNSGIDNLFVYGTVQAGNTPPMVNITTDMNGTNGSVWMNNTLAVSFEGYDVDVGDVLTMYLDENKNGSLTYNYSIVANGTALEYYISGLEKNYVYSVSGTVDDASVNSSSNISASRYVNNYIPGTDRTSDINGTNTTVFVNSTICASFRGYEIDPDALEMYINVTRNQTEITFNSSAVSNYTAIEYCISSLQSNYTYTISASVSDGDDNSSITRSSDRYISYYNPHLAAAPTLTPANPASNENLECNYTIYTIESDTSTAQITWYLNGANSTGNYTSVSGLNNNTLYTTTLSSTNTESGDQWICHVQIDSTTGYNSSAVNVDLVPGILITRPENITYWNDVYLPLNVTTLGSSLIPDEWWVSINGGANVSFSPNVTFASPNGSTNVTVWMLNLSGDWFMDEEFWTWDSVKCNISFVGNTTCGGEQYKYILVCKEFASGIYQWDTQNMTYCKYGCMNGECLQLKNNETDICHVNQTVCIDGFNYIACYRDTDGIAKWNTTEVHCNVGCLNGRCITEFSVCTYGETKCSGDYIVSCQDDDSDGYYEWSVENRTFCNYGCMENITGNMLSGYCNYHSFDSMENIRNLFTGFGQTFSMTFGDIPTLRLFAFLLMALIFGGMLGVKLSWKMGWVIFVGVMFIGFVFAWVPWYIIALFIMLSAILFRNSLTGGGGGVDE